MINDLTDPFYSKNKSINKSVKKTISFSHNESTKKLMTDLVWLKQFVLDRKPVSQGDIVRWGLDLVAKEIGYEKLRKKYADELDNYKPSTGRKS